MVDVAVGVGVAVGVEAVGLAAGEEELGVGVAPGVTVGVGVSELTGLGEALGVGETCTLGKVDAPTGFEVPLRIGTFTVGLVDLSDGNCDSSAVNSIFISSFSFFNVSL